MHISIRASQSLLLLALLAFVTLSGFTKNTTKGIPAACQSRCNSPYGEVLGKSPRGIEAYSNCQSGCVIFEPNKWNGTYTGIKWQCVEYARR
jgi:hypothetical protein